MSTANLSQDDGTQTTDRQLDQGVRPMGILRGWVAQGPTDPNKKESLMPP
jgi:hypothetical protein